MRLRIFAALLPVLAAPVFAAANPDKLSRFDDLVRQGRDAFLASDLDRAATAYNQACPADVVATYPVAKEVTCESLLASVDEARGNLARAEQRYLHAVADAEQAGPAYRPLYCAKLIDLGEHYHRQGRTQAAESTLLQAVDLARTLAAVNPELLPEALLHLGGVYSDSPQPERGRAPLTEALAIVTSAAGDRAAEPPATEIAYAHSRLGMIELAAGHLREAESEMRKSVALATQALGEDHPVTAAYQTNLALTLIVERRFDNAWLVLRRAQFVVESRQLAAGPELAVICAEMGDVARIEGKFAQAEDYALQAISLLNLQPKPDARALAIAQVTLAGIYLRSHDTAAAEKILPEAVEVQRETAANPIMLGASIQLLGELRAQQRNWHAAEALDREAIGIYRRSESANANAAIAPLLRTLADVLKHEGGSKSEVRALESQARDILRTAPLQFAQATPHV